MFEQSLVQYENPQLIMHKRTKAALDENRTKAEKMILMSIEELISEGATDVVDMLDVLMPPRIVEESDKFWYQKVSRRPASSTDIENLRERFDNELLRQGAREIGLCDIRRNLHDQLFDELIRQEIIICPERGRLLRMLRRETELSLTSLLSCYESALAYGIKKKLKSYRETAHVKTQVTQLLSDIADLNDTIRDLEPKIAQIKKTTETREEEKQSEFEKEEDEIFKENKALLASLMQCVQVSIELES